MRVEFTEPTEGSPVNKIADAEVYFDDTDASGNDSPLLGMKLVGLSVWTGDRGMYVTYPSRAYTNKSGKREYFSYLRSAVLDDQKAIYRLKDFVLSEWKRLSKQ